MEPSALQHVVTEVRGSHDASAIEAQRCARFVREYLHPTLQAHFGLRDHLVVLSDGCGVGGDVEALVALGYRAVGIDPGPRRDAWPFRTCQHRLLGADGLGLPFRDGSFDAVLSFGVLDHIGTINHSYQLDPHAQAMRCQYVQEALRVTKPGGAVIVGVINRRCPVDPFHAPNCCGVRLHGPWDGHSVSWGQLRRWAQLSGQSQPIEALPFDRRVFAWEGLRARWWGRRWFPQILALIDTLFGSERLKLLRTSCLNPFLLVKITKVHSRQGEAGGTSARAHEIQFGQTRYGCFAP